MDDTFRDIPVPPVPNTIVGPNQVLLGKRFLPQQQVLLYSPKEWEDLTEEWAHFCLKKSYVGVQRFTGAGDRGIDVAGFVDPQKLRGLWDNYQCKHYDHALRPSDAFPEIGKIIWHSFQGSYHPPRRYFFVAPHGPGTTLAGYLADSSKLKQAVIEKWDQQVADNITSKNSIRLEGDFERYVERFDWSIFGAKSALEIIEDHRSCPHHAIRFGGGLPVRPIPGSPPSAIAPNESLYVAQLFAAYTEHENRTICATDHLKAYPVLNSHFDRQREAFYQAESLRVFARDNVPTGTFEALQEDIYDGVIDVESATHPDGFVRVIKVTQAAREMQITANALITSTHPKDRDGMCHQLANEDRLHWVKTK